MKRAIFVALMMTVASMGLGCRCFDNAVCGDGCGRCGFFKKNGCGIFGRCARNGCDDDGGGAYAGGPPVGR